MQNEGIEGWLLSLHFAEGIQSAENLVNWKELFNEGSVLNRLVTLLSSVIILFLNSADNRLAFK